MHIIQIRKLQKISVTYTIQGKYSYQFHIIIGRELEDTTVKVFFCLQKRLVSDSDESNCRYFNLPPLKKCSETKFFPLLQVVKACSRKRRKRKLRRRRQSK